MGDNRCIKVSIIIVSKRFYPLSCKTNAWLLILPRLGTFKYFNEWNGRLLVWKKWTRCYNLDARRLLHKESPPWHRAFAYAKSFKSFKPAIAQRNTITYSMKQPRTTLSKDISRKVISSFEELDKLVHKASAGTAYRWQKKKYQSVISFDTKCHRFES